LLTNDVVKWIEVLEGPVERVVVFYAPCGAISSSFTFSSLVHGLKNSSPKLGVAVDVLYEFIEKDRIIIYD